MGAAARSARIAQLARMDAALRRRNPDQPSAACANLAVNPRFPPSHFLLAAACIRAALTRTSLRIVPTVAAKLCIQAILSLAIRRNNALCLMRVRVLSAREHGLLTIV